MHLFEMSTLTRTPDLSCLILWIVLILLVGLLPLGNFVGHSHCEYIKWVPTAEDLRSPTYLLDIFSDIAGNAGLFFPLGYFLSRLITSSSRSRRLLLPIVSRILLYRCPSPLSSLKSIATTAFP